MCGAANPNGHPRDGGRVPAALILIAAGVGSLLAAYPAGAAEPAAPAFSPTDPTLPHDPVQPRSEEDQDRVEAAAQYTYGRLLLHREQYADALRNFQRAYRADPQAPSVLGEIVAVAFELERPAEAARYAVISAERNPTDPVLLRRLAVYLTEQEQPARALRLYQRAAELTADDQPDAAAVVMRFEMGRLGFLTDDYALAADSFAIVRQALNEPRKFGVDEATRKVLLRRPEISWTLMAEAFLKADRAAEAAEMFTQANAAKPNAARLALQLARVAAQQQNYKEALDRLDACLAVRPRKIGGEAYALLAECVRATSASPEEAAARLIQRLEEFQAADPQDAHAGYALADAYRAADRGEKAEKLLADLVRRAPTVEGYAAQIELYRAESAWDKLLQALGAAVVETVTLAPLSESVQPLVDDDAPRRAVLEAARARAAQDGPGIDRGMAQAAMLLALAGGDFERFDQFSPLATAAAGADRAELLIQCGVELLLAEQSDRAVQVFQTLVDENLLPEANAAAGYYYLAGALEMAGRTDEALQAADKAAELAPDTPRFASRTGWIQYHAGRPDDAEQTYLKFLEKYDRDHRSDEVRDAVREARLVLSNICVQQARMTDAEEWLEQVLDEFPEDVGALNDLGYLWVDQGQHLQRGLRMIQQAVAQQPDNEAYRDSLGWAYYRLERWEEAVQQLQQAAAGEEPDGVILDHLGDALLATGDTAGARDAWRRAVRKFREDNEPQRLETTRAKLQQHRRE
jgi:tetratricopeptide (TPR) repeat protein